jgi:uncharacterized phage-associated protein
LFNLEKLIQTCNYLLKKNNFSLNYTKLIKMLYLADKESLKGSLQTITGDKYVSMNNGPVLSELYDLIMDKWHKENEQNLWNNRFTRNGHDIIAMTDRIPQGELSAFETQILDQIYEHFGNFSLGEMINYVHKNCPEWKFPNGSSIPIKPIEILESIGRPPEEIEWILAESNAFEEEEQVSLSLTER